MIVESLERSKQKNYSVRAIISKMDGYGFRFDNSCQRAAGQWTPKAKSNLISDILQDNPVPDLTFAEQVEDGIVTTWNLDGKQRCSTVYEFYNGKFKISRAVRRYEITYQYWDKEHLDENGRPTAVLATFDIRNKTFADLPAELQERFLNYNFVCTLYLNCSNEDISYHIERYNDGKPMSASQKGMSVMGTECAEKTKQISGMSFFTDCGDYRQSEFRNGTIERVVVDSLVNSFYPDSWNKNEAMFSFVKESMKDEDFDRLADNISRLEEVFDEEVSDLFTSKDTCIWFALFEKFTKYGLEDSRFIDFLREFKVSLHSKEVNGESFDSISEKRNTRDKSIIAAKNATLESLMKEYFHWVGGVSVDEQFVMDAVGLDETELDMATYEHMIDDFETIFMPPESPLRDDSNRLSLIALMAYSVKNEVDFDTWFEGYAVSHTTYLKNQKQNYNAMLADFERFQSEAA